MTEDPQVLYSDRSSHYTNVALDKAHGADHPDWNPLVGWQANRARIIDVYGYYRDLALAQPDVFLWAGLGHMAGGAIVGGLDSDPGIVQQPIMVSIGRDIFYDLAWQHEAFLDGEDIVMLAGLHDQFAMYPRYDGDGAVTFLHAAPAVSYAGAWEKIVSGDPASIASGNRDLLNNEQASIVQPQYDFLRTVVGAGLAGPFTNEIHPYHRAFLVEIPGGDILQFDSRWRWITFGNGMYDNWAAAGSDERARLLQLPFDQILRGDFGVPGRPDLLPPGGP